MRHNIIGWLFFIVGVLLGNLQQADRTVASGELTRNGLPEPKIAWAHPHHRGIAKGVAVSDDGRFLAVAFFDRTIVILSLSTGMELKTLVGPVGRTTWLEFQPKGNTLASMHELAGTRVVKLWDVVKGDELHGIQPYPSLKSAAWQPDGKLVAVSAFGTGLNHKALGFWNPATGENVKTWSVRDAMRPMLFTPDGKRLIGMTGATNPVLRAWDVETAKELRPLLIASDPLAKICVSPCSKWLVISEAKKSIRLVDINGKEARSFSLPPDVLHDIAYFPDGRFVVGAFQAAEPYLLFWDPATGKEVLRYKTSHIARLAISPDSKLLAGAGGGGVQVYHLQREVK